MAWEGEDLEGTEGELPCAWSVAAADMSARRQASSVDSGGEKSGADGLPDIRGHGSATASERKRRRLSEICPFGGDVASGIMAYSE